MSTSDTHHIHTQSNTNTKESNMNINSNLDRTARLVKRWVDVDTEWFGIGAELDRERSAWYGMEAEYEAEMAHVGEMMAICERIIALYERQLDNWLARQDAMCEAFEVPAEAWS